MIGRRLSPLKFINVCGFTRRTFLLPYNQFRSMLCVSLYYTYAFFVCNIIKGFKSNIVSCVVIFLSRIPQSDDYFHKISLHFSLESIKLTNTRKSMDSRVVIFLSLVIVYPNLQFSARIFSSYNV